MFVKHMPDLSKLSPSDLNQTVANGTHFYGHILSSGRECGYLSHRDLPPTFYSWNGLPGEIEYFLTDIMALLMVFLMKMMVKCHLNMLS